MAENNTTTHHVSTTLGSRMANNIHNNNNSNNRVYEVKPTKAEIMIWYLYEFCSYFVHTVLIPLVFPLIISQTVSLPTVFTQGWFKNSKDLKCSHSEMLLYEGLVHKAIHLGALRISPLEWTSISWLLGLLLSAPVLGVVSIHLDYGHNQQVVAGLATAIGALFCLPAGFFRTPWIFLPYIALIVTAITIVGGAHARHLGLMILGFTGSSIPRRHFPNRRAFGSWLSLNSTAAGSVGAAIMAAFTYLMLRRSDHFTALWVVSIFSGLIWAVGMIHICTGDRNGGIFTDSSSNASPMVHVVSIFRYPHAVGSFLVVLLSAFVAMSVFGGGLLHAMGNLCVKSENILFLWLVYFMFPVLSLPLTHPLQQKLKLDAEKMQLLGFVLSIFTSGFGFYYRQSIWSKSYMLLFAAIQGTATGLMHAFGRVLLLDCSPAGKEGAFSVWFSWARALGTCAGFALATAMPRNIGKTFGVSFCAGIIGMVVLIFGNISSFRGAKAAGHVMSSEKGSPVHELHNVADNHQKGTVRSDVLSQGKAEV